MKQFQAKFIEDASELLQDLEKNILELEDNRTNKNLIEEIYRVMHTLKGASAMFGFEKISEFTHHLENIYDYILEGKYIITDEILNVTFLSVDLLKSLLEDAELTNQSKQQTFNQLSAKFIEIINEMEGKPAEVTALQTEEETGGYRSYFVKITTLPDLFRRGVNMISLINEMHDYGTCLVFPILNQLMQLQEHHPTECFMHWNIVFSSNAPKDEIEDIFIFVPDESEIKEISQTNILENTQVVNNIHKLVADNNLTLETLNELITPKNQFSAEKQTQTEKKQEPTIIEKKPAETVTPKIEKQFVTKEAITKTQPTTSQHENNDSMAQEVPTNQLFKEQKNTSIRVASLKLDELMNLVSELVTTKAELNLLSKMHKIPQLSNVAERLDKLSRQFRDNALSIRLVPISTILTNFKRLIRDLSVEFGKDIEFVTEGADTELDKTIIDNLSTPLMHLIRNSVDHGIELPNDRIQKGKTPTGIIKLAAFYSGTNVVIKISDNGKGIDNDVIKEKAVKKGIISAEVNLSKKEILDIIFLPGFSTAQVVSEVSGRGVGMDVVKQRIADLRGEVEVETTKDVGTTFTIKLPLTLSIVDTLLVKLADVNYLIPLSFVENCNEVSHTDIEKAKSNRIVFDNKLVPFINLRKEFNLAGEPPKSERVIIIRYDTKRVGLLVDSVVGEHQAVLKTLGEIYRVQSLISGASILGDGSVALVIDTTKMIEKYMNKTIE